VEGRSVVFGAQACILPVPVGGGWHHHHQGW